MTKDTTPAPAVRWEPNAEGIVFSVDAPHQPRFECNMPMPSVREVRDDMQEASWQARGFEKIECMVNEIIDQDFIDIGGQAYKVINLLQGDETYVVQFELNMYAGEAYTEVMLPGDLQVTVWRAIQ